MSAAKHTPGPWMPAANWPHGLSMVCQHDGTGWKPLADCSVSGDAAEANARLIAAAPALLAELQNIANADPRKWDEETRDQFQQWAQNRARAAIGKATGGAQ